MILVPETPHDFIGVLDAANRQNEPLLLEKLEKPVLERIVRDREIAEVVAHVAR